MFSYIKKYFIIVLIIILISNLTSVCNAMESSYVSREDAIIEIMSVVGVEQETALNTIMYTSWYIPVFNDVKACRIEDGYVLIASEYITKGCGNRLFEPNRDILLVELLTFIERCLRDDSSIEPNQAMSFALEDNIIFPEDKFYCIEGNIPITKADLDIMINRMCEKNIGLYIGLIEDDDVIYSDIRIYFDSTARAEWKEINYKLMIGEY